MSNIKMLPRYRIKSSKKRYNSKTHKEYIEELKIKNPNLIVIDQYMGAKIKIKHYCKVHNCEFDICPSSALLGSGCDKCHSEKISKKIKRSHDEYIKEVNIKNPNIEVLGKYMGSDVPIIHRCIKHNIIWNVSPTCILRGGGCELCGNEKISKKLKKTHLEYVNELKLVNPNIEVIEEYKTALIPILHRCLVDNTHIPWYGTPANILKGSGCPECNISHGEKEISIWLNNHNINYTSQKTFPNCRDSKSLPFDFYIADKNLCIEYDSKQHFEPIDWFGGETEFKKRKHHDEIKTNYCKNNGITLLRIPYYKNIEEELNNFLVI